ncbi:tetratricopeptide repeat protein [Candidatus Methylomirabilis sp.]|uniref:tetratricopeptide repeat protein n=1 Tax=Candidatus Methylomirabilis sp. TaxID=2032687 RepID=UPI002A61A74A|nr:tetratricopeptide repeat protein [Candidatus Methylomirabilis sp.]
MESYPGVRHDLQVKTNQISTVVLGKPLTICPLSSLPRIDEGVLLDIDSDFLMIPRVSYQESDEHGALPWCWPEDLLARLHACHIRADLATIAYSVEGGYTPLKWKYLGDELAFRLRRPDHCGDAIRGMRLIREAVLAAHHGDLVTAEAKYHEAGQLLPDLPALHYHLAHLYVEMGRIDDGQKSYRRALALDVSYRTAYNSAGLHYHLDGCARAVEREYRRALALDPEDAYAHCGLGRLAAQRRHWNEAEALLRKSLALDEHLINAYRTLGDVLVKQGRCEEAIRAYEQSLKLALAGYKPLKGSIATYANSDHRVIDQDHGRIHARLARLYELKGSTTEAINGYRIGIAGGYDGVLLRSRLAHLFLKQGHWLSAVEETWQVLKVLPVDLRKAGRRFLRHLRLIIEDGHQALPTH